MTVHAFHIPGRPFAPGPDPRRGTGRKHGSKNRATLIKEAAMASEVLQLRPFAGSAHDLLVAVYSDQTLPLQARVAAAGMALRVEPAPSSSPKSLTPEQRAARIAELLRERAEGVSAIHGPQASDRARITHEHEEPAHSSDHTEPEKPDGE